MWKDRRALGIDLDNCEGSFELADASGDEDDVGTLGRQLFSHAETHSFGCAGEEDRLDEELSVEGIMRGSHEESQDTYPALNGHLVSAEKTHDEGTEEDSCDRSTKNREGCRRGKVHSGRARSKGEWTRGTSSYN